MDLTTTKTRRHHAKRGGNVTALSCTRKAMMRKCQYMFYFGMILLLTIRQLRYMRYAMVDDNHHSTGRTEVSDSLILRHLLSHDNNSLTSWIGDDSNSSKTNHQPKNKWFKKAKKIWNQLLRFRWWWWQPSKGEVAKERSNTTTSKIPIPLVKTFTHRQTLLKRIAVRPKIDHGRYSPAHHSNKSIAFLFVAGERRWHEGMWERWFADANTTYPYSIFVHGTPTLHHPPGPKRPTLPLGKFLCQHIIPYVYSEWYWLYDVQMQLLQHAYKNDPNASHFVFVSDTSIPLVSYDEMYYRMIIFPDHQMYRDKIITNYQSRFCYFPPDRTDHAWQHVYRPLSIPKKHLRKAEMWSIITRPHVKILLENKYKMDIWNRTFYQQSLVYTKKEVGAPDETIISTMLQTNVKARREMMGNPIDCNPINNGKYGCCSTMIFWQHTKDPVYVHDYYSAEAISYYRHNKKYKSYLLSDACHARRPCNFYDALYEKGLIKLRDNGYFFFRKLPYMRRANITAPKDSIIDMALVYNNMTVRIDGYRHHSISLYDALPLLHQRIPMSTFGASRHGHAAAADHRRRQQQQEQQEREFVCYATRPATIVWEDGTIIKGSPHLPYHNDTNHITILNIPNDNNDIDNDNNNNDNDVDVLDYIDNNIIIEEEEEGNEEEQDENNNDNDVSADMEDEPDREGDDDGEDNNNEE